MALTNYVEGIVTQLVNQLENIDGGTNYNFEINPSAIEVGYREFDQFNSYPAICIALVKVEGSTQTDQVTYEVPIRIELYAYTKRKKGALDEVLKLIADVEKAIYTDETLDGKVWGLSLNIEAVSYNEYGIGVINLMAKFDYDKTA